MKKGLIIICGIAVVTLFAALVTIKLLNNESGYSFEAKLLEVRNEDTLLVEVLNDNNSFKKGDQVVVHFSKDDNVTYTVDTKINITFNGEILETYPPQITGSKIELVK